MMSSFLRSLLLFSVLRANYAEISKDNVPMKENSVLTPVGFSASSVYENHFDFMPFRANINVFKSNEETPTAWCPSQPTKDEMREWLQVEFADLKLINIILTRGRGQNTEDFVPSFFIRYQRTTGQWNDYVSHSGERLIEANVDSSRLQSINLSPPIVALQLRIYPFHKSVSRLMCLKLATLGQSFNDSVIEYEIPEGDIYRDSNLDLAASLNDSSYDGSLHVYSSPFDETFQQRNTLRSGMGVLMDKSIYLGSLSDVLNSSYSLRLSQTGAGSPNSQALSVIGWFCRAKLPLSMPINMPCTSRNVTLLFKFNSVRQFFEVSIHAFNAHRNRVAVFRQAYVQFSIGGEFFDQQNPPLVYEYPRDDIDFQPRWIQISLNRRVGAHVKIILTFDFDWIVLSEVEFNSTLVTWPVKVEEYETSVREVQLNSVTSHTENATFSAQSTESMFENTFPIVDRQLPQQYSEDFALLVVIICSCLGTVILLSLLLLAICRFKQFPWFRLEKKQSIKSFKSQSINKSKASQPLTGSFNQCVPNSKAISLYNSVQPSADFYSNCGVKSNLNYSIANNRISPAYTHFSSIIQPGSQFMNSHSYPLPEPPTFHQSSNQRPFQLYSPVLTTINPASQCLSPGFHCPPAPPPPLYFAAHESTHDGLNVGFGNTVISPYAAASLNGLIQDERHMVASIHTDGSLPDYASASISNSQLNSPTQQPPSLLIGNSRYTYQDQNMHVPSSAQ